MVEKTQRNGRIQPLNVFGPKVLIFYIFFIYFSKVCERKALPMCFKSSGLIVYLRLIKWPTTLFYLFFTLFFCHPISR